MLTNLRDAFGGQSRSPNIVPFPYVRYSFLLCNSNFVFKTNTIFDFKKFHDLEMGVKGYSRSLRVISIDRLCRPMVSY